MIIEEQKEKIDNMVCQNNIQINNINMNILGRENLDMVTDDVKKARWKKLVWNAPFNPISVLSHGLNTIEILSNPLTKELVENVMKEVQQAAALDGVCLEDYVLEKNISDTLTMKPYKIYIYFHFFLNFID